MTEKLYQFIGEQVNYPESLPPIRLYNLLKAVPGHPKGSTLCQETLVNEGLWTGESL